MEKYDVAIDLVEALLECVGCDKCPCQYMCEKGTKCNTTIKNFVQDLANKNLTITSSENMKGEMEWKTI